MLSRKKLLSYLLILSIVIGLSLLTGYFYWTRGIYVAITNNTDSVLKNINIFYTGGVINIEELEPNNSYDKYINPTGESDLELEWNDSSRTRQSSTIDVYFEPNYSGSVEITIDPNNQVSCKDKTRIRLF